MRLLSKRSAAIALCALCVAPQQASSQIDVKWDPNPETDIVGYDIAVWPTDGNRSAADEIPLRQGPRPAVPTEAILRGYDDCTMYDSAVRAVNSGGGKSDEDSDIVRSMNTPLLSGIFETYGPANDSAIVIAEQGQAVRVTLEGVNFYDNEYGAGWTQIEIGGSGVTVSNVQILGCRTLEADLQIAAWAAPGYRQIGVSNPDPSPTAGAWRIPGTPLINGLFILDPDRSPPADEFLRVAGVRPRASHYRLVPDAQPVVMFDAPVDPQDLAAADFYFVDTGGGQIPAASVRHASRSLDRVRVEPAQAFDYDTNYTLVVRGGNSGVRDLDGRVLENDFQWTFRTEMQPSSATIPAPEPYREKEESSVMVACTAAEQASKGVCSEYIRWPAILDAHYYELRRCSSGDCEALGDTRWASMPQGGHASVRHGAQETLWHVAQRSEDPSVEFVLEDVVYEFEVRACRETWDGFGTKSVDCSVWSNPVEYVGTDYGCAWQDDAGGAAFDTCYAGDLIPGVE